MSEDPKQSPEKVEWFQYQMAKLADDIGKSLNVNPEQVAGIIQQFLERKHGFEQGDLNIAGTVQNLDETELIMELKNITMN